TSPGWRRWKATYAAWSANLRRYGRRAQLPPGPTFRRPDDKLRVLRPRVGGLRFANPPYGVSSIGLTGRSSNHRPLILDCPVKRGNDNGEAHEIKNAEAAGKKRGEQPRPPDEAVPAFALHSPNPATIALG